MSLSLFTFEIYNSQITLETGTGIIGMILEET